MKPIIRTAVREGIVILVVSFVAGLGVNQARREGIPLIAEAEAFRVKTDAEFIKAEDAYGLFEEGTAIFLDARAPELFEVRRIEGAMNISSTGHTVESMAWVSGTNSYIICYAGEENQREAGVLADMLLAMDCKRVRVLHGGIEGWMDKGLPTEGVTD